jgi:uncharacterized membrane protein SpoIIM required for sporulation
LETRLISTRWIKKREPYWKQLEDLLQQSSAKGLASLNRSQLQDLSLLYRQTAADLATLRADPSSVHFARYVNQLLARAHNTIYSGQRASAFGIVAFFWKTYPGVFRRNRNFCFGALAIFLIGAAFGTIATVQDPDFKLSVLGPQMVETIDRREMWTHSILAIKPLASSTIMTNNLSVAFVTFATGITAGLGTIYMLFFNGLMMGVIGTACWLAGMSLKLWSFVIPHGVLELPAIFIAGGAGLKLAQGLLFPGVLPRKESLVLAGKEGGALVLGAIPLLVVAGVIEAFVSPTGIDVRLKFAVGGALLLLLATYLYGLGKHETTTTRALSPEDRS